MRKTDRCPVIGIPHLALLLSAWLAAWPANALPLWELTGTRNHVMVLGSIHTLRAGDYPLNPAIMEALRSADVVVMELDMDDPAMLASAATIQTLAVDPRGRELPEVLGQALWRKSQAQARQLGLDLTPLAGFEPWYAAVIVTQERLNQLGFDPGLGVESRMTAEAVKAGKEIRGLESLESQLKALDSLSPEAQAGFFAATLDEAATIDDEVDGMIAAWKSGDVKALDQDMLGSVREQPEVYRAIIVRRNAHFSRVIGGLANDSKDYLVVVGTLHLVGPDSVLKMLADDGHPSRQVPGR